MGQAGHAYNQLMAAICQIQLGDYQDARTRCNQALRLFLDKRAFWMNSSQPELLVESYVLAGAPAEFYKNVRNEVEGYKLDYRGKSGVALYSYAVVRLMADDDGDAGGYVSALEAITKEKWLASLGAVLRAIMRYDQPGLDASLGNLLSAHRGMAKFGDLRSSPEGFLSLAAMCLSKTAIDRGMVVTIESEYLSLGYLRYLRSLHKAR
jgi:hypothetical protein